MLGRILSLAEDMRNKQRSPQRPHRGNMKEFKRYFMRFSKLGKGIVFIQTALLGAVRKGKALISYSNKFGRRLAYKLRKDKLNGK